MWYSTATEQSSVQHDAVSKHSHNHLTGTVLHCTVLSTDSRCRVNAVFECSALCLVVCCDSCHQCACVCVHVHVCVHASVHL